MVRRLRPLFHPGMSPRALADALNRIGEDLYNLVGNHQAAAPLNVQEDTAGVRYWLDLQAAASVIGANYLSSLFSNSTITLNNDSLITYNFPSGGDGIGGIVFDVPVEICGYQFWCCTTLGLSSASYNNLALPTVGTPDQGATVYVVNSTNTGGSTVTGLQPVAMGLALNTGDITAATNVSPIVLTVPGWTTTPTVGQGIIVAGVNGNTAANGAWTVQAATSTTVTLQGSTGNGAFTTSAGSTVRLIGPQILAIKNATANAVTLSNKSSSSNPACQFYLPPTYGSSVALAQNDTILLWWDDCVDRAWNVLACTPDIDSGSNGGVNLQSGTTYTFVASDTGKVVSFTNAASIAATLPIASSLGTTWLADVENRGVGTLTITPTTSTIDGAASLALTTNQGVRIFSDGTNYYTQRGLAPAPAFSGAEYDNYSSVSVPNNTLTALPKTGSTMLYDTDSYTASFTLPDTNHYYKGWFQVFFPTIGTYNALVRVTDTIGTNFSQVNVGNAGGSTLTVQCMFDIKKGDNPTLAVNVSQSSGAAMNVNISKAVIWRQG